MDRSDGVAVRRAVPDDAQAIGAVFDAAVRHGWTYLGEAAREPMFAPREWDRLIVDHAPPNVLLVVDDRQGRVVAFAAAHPADGELHLLFVDPAHAGQGLGRLLLEAAHDALRAAGCTQAHLFTHERNDRALAVYTRAGYRTDGAVRDSEFKGVAMRELRLVARL